MLGGRLGLGDGFVHILWIEMRHNKVNPVQKGEDLVCSELTAPVSK